MSSNISELLATDESPLTPSDAVVALITVGDDYLMQLRDLKPGIFYPGHWGLFGGAIESDENEMEALLRELEEELELKIDSMAAHYFTRFNFDFSPLDGPKVFRSIYEIKISKEIVRGLKLREGREMRVFTLRDILEPSLPVTPYDAFVLWMHGRRSLFVR